MAPSSTHPGSTTRVPAKQYAAVVTILIEWRWQGGIFNNRGVSEYINGALFKDNNIFESTAVVLNNFYFLGSRFVMKTDGRISNQEQKSFIYLITSTSATVQ